MSNSTISLEQYNDIYKDVVSKSANGLSELFKSLSRQETFDAYAYESIANAFRDTYKNYADVTAKYSDLASQMGDPNLSNLYTQLSDKYSAIANEGLSEGSEAYAKRCASLTKAALHDIRGLVGPFADGVELLNGFCELALSGGTNGDPLGRAGCGVLGAALFGEFGCIVLGAAAVGFWPGVVIGALAVGGVYAGEYMWDHYLSNLSKNPTDNTYRIVWLSADPLTLDLDGDGIETTAVNGATGALFDHNNDGIATATGWLKPDDGFLVRDINGNGIIDTGAELFGDSTLLSDGNNAANGFAALADLDTNGDGVVNASDAAFSQLRVWRDLNQDGVSQADELFTLEQQGIQSLDTAIAGDADITLPGGVQAETGSYTRLDADGNPVTTVMADVNLRQDPFYSQYTDSIPVPEELLDLPNLSGMGRLRNLQEAAALSPALADALTQYAAAQTRMEQRALLDQVLLEWAKTDPQYTEDSIQVWFSSFGGLSYDENSTNVIYLRRGQSVGVVQPTLAEPELLHRAKQQKCQVYTYDKGKDGLLRHRDEKRSE